MDLKSVNLFTVRHHFSMPNLEHELSGLKDAVYFVDFDMLHG